MYYLVDEQTLKEWLKVPKLGALQSKIYCHLTNKENVALTTWSGTDVKEYLDGNPQLGISFDNWDVISELMINEINEDSGCNVEIQDAIANYFKYKYWRE